MTDDSFYWAGWCEYKQNNFAGAILKFENLDEKVHYIQAQFRIAESYYNLKNYMKRLKSHINELLILQKDVELIVQLHYSLDRYYIKVKI